MHKRVSQDFRFPEAGILVYVVLHELQTINLKVTSTNEMTKLSANFLECEGVKNEILLWGFSYMHCTNFRYFDTKTKINVILL